MRIGQYLPLCILKKLQVPKIPTGGNKRRMPDAPTPEMLKKMRLASEGASTITSMGSPPHSTAPSKRVASVQDADDDDDDDDVAGDIRGQTFAPGNDADYFAEEDEDGRFFGGGLTNEQKEILNIFDNAGASQVPDDVRIHAPSIALCSSLAFTSPKCSPLRALKSCCCGWREPLIRTSHNGRNILTIQRSEWC